MAFEQIPSPNLHVVNCIIRDDRGFLWFGSAHGLCKYDGYQVRVLLIGNNQSLEGKVIGHDRQVVEAIIKMEGESLLLGTDLGLWSFNSNTEEFTPFLPNEEFSQSRITALARDSNGTIWVGTESQGLFACNLASQKIRHFTTENTLSDNRITSLLLDHSGTLWIGTIGAGLTNLDISMQQTRSYSKQEFNILQSNEITALCESAEGELWIGTNQSLNVLDSTRKQMRSLDIPSDIQHTVWSIAQDPNGTMFVAVSDLGLLTYHRDGFAPISASSDIVRTLHGSRFLYFDPLASSRRRSLLWIATRNGVVKLLQSVDPFTNHIRNQDSLQLDRGAVLSVYEDHNSILWVGLWGGGLQAFHRENGHYKCITHFKNVLATPFSLPTNDVGSIVEDSEGNLWIGTGAGLAMLDPQRKFMKIYKHKAGDFTSIPSNAVNIVFEDRSGTIWVCTDGGLSKLVWERNNLAKVENIRKVLFKNYLSDPADAHSLGVNKVSFVFQDHLSNLWVATYGRGLNKLEVNGSFRRFKCPTDTVGTHENFIYTIAEDHQGFLWLSTGVGLVVFDPRSGEFQRYQVEQLYDAHIFGIAPDDQGNLWLSTGIGLARCNHKTHSFARYDESDGMPFKEFFSGFYRDKGGRLLAGAIDGFTEFSPENVLTISYPPHIAIANISVFEKELPASVMMPKVLTLPYDQNFVSFSFVALDYVNSSKNRFAYKMVGVDRDWIEAGTRNYASYPNLDPGSYMFQVKGCNSDNVWNEAGTSISFIITPPYWQTWWFRTLMTVLIAGMAYASYRYRLRRLLEVERLRLRIADDLHDDVGSNLSVIAMVSRVVQRAPELSASTKHLLAEIYETAITTSEGMKDIVWFIKPKNDTLDDLLLRMKDTASSLLAGVQHDFHTSRYENSTKVTIDFKRNFFLAFKEILTNIVKHASATKVEIQVKQRDGMLETVIRDNGQGFDRTVQDTLRRGNGLGSLQNRAEGIGGACEITSLVGKGTTVKFCGKL